ncbi:period circadian protein homolog 2-like isoform X7 [Anguilla rostrata]|uniref:period circadian protein homolog 2-like isoform X7 n=1 Tax=Anguilla rostrata TaxID=7938 RepID=UPI0030CB9707
MVIVNTALLLGCNTMQLSSSVKFLERSGRAITSGRLPVGRWGDPLPFSAKNHLPFYGTSMSDDSDSKPYLYSALEGRGEGAVACSAMSQLHRMGGYGEGRGRGGAELGLASEGSDSSSQGPGPSPHSDRKRARSLHEEDVEMKSSGSCGSGTESHSNESHGNDSHGNESHGNESLRSSNGNSKDSALLVSSGSNKSSNSHSPSPPSSSNAFSLLSASSEQDNPSTSGCSSEESAKAKTQKELLKTLKELKLHLPSEKRQKGNKSSTLSALKYALRCVKQVEANEEYYQLLMINDSQPSGLDVSSYTIEEIDSITSEYTLKNTDIFAVAVSLISGKIVYISDQASCILNCKQSNFKNAKFVEFLTPQDVSVFYSFTTPYRLPSWSMCTGAESSPSDCMQEKSFFCRISGGRERGGDPQYYPFRMTPYRMKVQDTEHAEDQFCCLLLAERVHSGYEAPRIPTDKRIFTTTHTPGCIFQDVDERAIPLLGFLPQDLIGTPILLHLHPNDRPIMLAIHKKILQYAGQPFDHSSIRFCARNGEYVTIDTSWSSFVNPWSRKVSFIIGRHKVRMGPVNEDVFAAPPSTEVKTMDSDIQEITEQIHRLLLQPVHNNGSSCYGSMGSNEHLMSVASSSDSNGGRPRPEEEESRKAKPRTFQEVCKGVHMQKNQYQQGAAAFPPKAEPKRMPSKSQQKSPVVRPKDSAVHLSGKENVVSMEDLVGVQEELTYKDETVYSYQQISCLDSVIRYLDSCSVPITVKRKCQSSSNTASTNSDEDKQNAVDNAMQVSEEPALLEAQPGLPPVKVHKKPPGAAVGSSLAPLALPSKAESVMSITSQCSYSSTIVHVGDKKPQPESEIIGDVSGAGEMGEGPAVAPPSSAVSLPSQEREAYKKLGLTKHVLAAHTQKEEQVFLSRFRDLRGMLSLQADCSVRLDRQRGQPATDAAAAQGRRQGKAGGRAESANRRGGRNKKTKSKRVKKHESSDSTVSHRKQSLLPPRQGLNQTSWSPSDTSQSTTLPMAYPAVMPAYPMQMYPGAGPANAQVNPSLPGFGESQCGQDPRLPMPPTPYSTPLVTPMVALVLPNYMFPQMGGAPHQPFYPDQTSFPPQAAFNGPAPFSATPAFHVQPQFASQNPFPAQLHFQAQPFPYGMPAEAPKSPAPEPREGVSRSSTPQSLGANGQASPPLFQSRCSSPLQLNLLQLEETPRSTEKMDSSAPPGGSQGNGVMDKGSAAGPAKSGQEKQQRSLHLSGLAQTSGGSANDPGPTGPAFPKPTCSIDVLLPWLQSQEGLSWDKVCCRLVCGSEEMGSHSDANSTLSDLMDILLQEDSRSGTGSATSGSLGSRSNGCGGSASGGSASGTGSSHVSNNSSKYFGSIDSSQNSHKTQAPEQEAPPQPFAKCVLQDPLWLLMADADESVMMTYQLPSREVQKVLKEDRERLHRMQKSQPCFTEQQKKELVEVHPWMKKGGLPQAINVKACACCEDASSALIEEESPDLEMGETNDEAQKGSEEAQQAEHCHSH